MSRGNRRSAHDSVAGKLKAAQSLSVVVNADVPAGFELDDEETPIFRSYAQTREGWTPAERHMLARLSQHEVFIRRQTTIITEVEGDLVENTSGNKVANPRWGLIHAAERSHLQLLGKLHLAGTTKQAQVGNNNGLGKALLKHAPGKPVGDVDWAAKAGANVTQNKGA
jgi:hypothetical protein